MFYGVLFLEHYVDTGKEKDRTLMFSARLTPAIGVLGAQNYVYRAGK